MKIRKPTLFGCIAWTAYFFLLMAAIFCTALMSAWHLAVGIGFFIVTMLVLAIGHKVVLSMVGAIDTEFVIGLLAGVALVISAAIVIGKIRGHVHPTGKASASVELGLRPNNSFKPKPLRGSA